MITRYVLEIDHKNPPVDGELIAAPNLIGMAMNAVRPKEEDDVDIEIFGIRVYKVSVGHVIGAHG